jgi:hypothetical protein
LSSRVVVEVVAQLPQAVAALVDSVPARASALPLAPITPLRLEQAALVAPVVVELHFKE